MREYFPDLIGNDRLRARIGEELAQGRLSHAYLLVGPPGSGKHTFALQLAAALACEAAEGDTPLPCGKCPSCRAILEGRDPDVITVSRGERVTLGVEQLREVMEQLYIAPNWHEDKIYIIEDAQTMTAQAQNALLIALEEPPRHVRFLLLCTEPEAMLETIRSRALMLRMAYIPPELMRDWLIRHDRRAATLAESNPDEFNAITLAADGCIGSAQTLLDARRRKPVMARRESAERFLSLCAARRGAGEVLTALSALPQKRDEASELFGLISLGARDLLAVKRAPEARLCFYTNRAAAEETAAGMSLQAVLRLIDALETARTALGRNANMRITQLTLAQNAGLL